LTVFKNSTLRKAKSLDFSTLVNMFQKGENIKDETRMIQYYTWQHLTEHFGSGQRQNYCD